MEGIEKKTRRCIVEKTDDRYVPYIRPGPNGLELSRREKTIKSKDERNKKEKKCIYGKYRGEYVPETRTWEACRCTNTVRPKDEKFSGQSSFCEQHQKANEMRRRKFLEDKDSYYEKYCYPEPSTQCKGCGDYSIYPGLENKNLCNSCRKDL